MFFFESRADFINDQAQGEAIASIVGMGVRRKLKREREHECAAIDEYTQSGGSKKAMMPR